MFFIAKISKKGSLINIDETLVQSSIIKQLKFHRKLLEMDLNVKELMQPQISQNIKNIAQAIKN